METLKNRKAPRCDNIQIELLKYCGKYLTEELTKVFSNRRGKVPLEWKTGIVIPIFRKGNKNNLENYRGMTLLNMTQILLVKVILEKVFVCNWLNIRPRAFL